jgi:hypothetical protein
MKKTLRIGGMPKSFLKIHLDPQTLKTSQIRQFRSL